jgi:type II secretory pathway pseudopilin PulG
LTTGAFTLLETLLVVALLALVAGTAVALLSGTREKADEQLIQTECAEIRRAILQFRADLGQSPQRLAELLQSPNPGNALGGWWWRSAGDRLATTLHSHDPATRRGWNGPYLKADALSDANQSGAEKRLISTGIYAVTAADPTSGERLAVMLSRYATYPQRYQNDDASRPVSHYQLDASDSSELAVRFVADPLAAPDEAVVVARLKLGVEP